MKHLFSPFRIKHCVLKNRIVMPPLASFLLEKGGEITEKAVEHYRLRAAGGPAMVMMEACAVSPEGVVSHNQARIDHDRFIEGLSKIAQVVKSEGAVPAVQIHHGGRQTSVRVIGRKPLAPSPLPCPAIRGDVEPLTLGGIQELILRFGDAAERACAAGFELIEIHGAHGYLINQFLSRFSNIREDHFGGDIPGRTRFAKEIVAEIRKRIGEDFPLSFKISAQEFVSNGLTPRESIEILKILVEAGVDAVQVSAGNDATPEWIAQPMFMKQACLVDSAELIKKAIHVPVMAVGRINDPVIADEIIGAGKADLVCMGRGLLADPELPIKAREGRLDDIRTCIACNTCMESIFKKGRVECLVNPTLGREKEMALRPAPMTRKVMVIGGGPGGLNVAWIAARRGHHVHLYERTSSLGGQLVLGCVTTFKMELRSLIKYLTRQIEKSGVICHLDHEVTLATVEKEDPDVVILATGSSPFLPPLPGTGMGMVCTISEVLNGNSPVPVKTVVVGGGPTGCEVAHHLSEQGIPVTIIEMLPNIGSALETMTRKILLSRLKDAGVSMMKGCRVSRIEETGVVVIGEEEKEIFVEAEKVVMAVGNRSDDTLYDQIRSLGYEIHKIGDCLEPRSAKAAIYEGAVLGRTL
jgi:2,4-dienoyl-CoA reductase-like NADH-dependent reductase (Old Yellow Enzyme family)/thioredoxin reductase